MKDLFFIDSNLAVNFWADIINTANYLWNWLLINCNSSIFILKEVLINKKQNIKHIYIFENKVNTFKSSEKYI